MTIFALIVLIVFVFALCGQFIAALNRGCIGLAILFAFEILAFAYLAQQLKLM